MSHRDRVIWVMGLRHLATFGLLSSLVLLPLQLRGEIYEAATAGEAIGQFKTWFPEQKVLSFVGFSGKGYEDFEGVKAEVVELLNRYPASEWVVNIGATPDGIGGLYPLVKSLGYGTAGIVSQQVVVQRPDSDRPLSEEFPDVDRVIVVEDDSWGGFDAGTMRLSPTSRVMVGVTDSMMAFGGGSVGRDEMIAALMQTHKVIGFQFFPYDMRHSVKLTATRKHHRGELSDAYKALQTGGFSLLQP